jgi:hypothetical protein
MRMIFSKEDKEKFITNLMDGIKQELLDKVSLMPEDWDGLELRQLIADYTKEQAEPERFMYKKRKKDYEMSRLIRGI